MKNSSKTLKIAVINPDDDDSLVIQKLNSNLNNSQNFIKGKFSFVDLLNNKSEIKNIINGKDSILGAVLILKKNLKPCKKYLYLLNILAIKQIIIALDYTIDQKNFNQLRDFYTNYARQIDLKINNVIMLNLAAQDLNCSLKWYNGPNFVEAFNSFKVQNRPALRIAVKEINHASNKTVIKGVLKSGKVKPKDKIVFSPNNFEAETLAVKLAANDNIYLTIKEALCLKEGNIISHKKHLPLLSDVFKATILIDQDCNLEVGKYYKIKLNCGEYKFCLKEIKKVFDKNLNEVAQEFASKNQIAHIVCKINGIAAFDNFSFNQNTGKFEIINQEKIVGRGIIDINGFANQRYFHKIKSQNLSHEKTKVTYADQIKMNGHKGGIVWFTGLSGAGKTTLAKELQKQLYEKNIHSFILDGDNIRKGLSSDLGFSHSDRSENVRRVSYICKLFAEAGYVVIASLIAPYAKDREFAKSVAPDFFHTIYIKATLDDCKKRDPKGLYYKALHGQIKNMTGIDDVYEAPQYPDLTVNTSQASVSKCVDMLVKYVMENVVK